MLAAFPLMVVPLFVYNGLVFAPLIGRDLGSLSQTLTSVTMMSGAVWSMQVSDILIAAALLLLFIEVLKATRTGPLSIADHLLSTLVFIAFLIEFLVVAEAATDTFFILTMIAFIDLVAGFSVSIRSAGRDVSIGL